MNDTCNFSVTHIYSNKSYWLHFAFTWDSSSKLNYKKFYSKEKYFLGTTKIKKTAIKFKLSQIRMALIFSHPSKSLIFGFMDKHGRNLLDIRTLFSKHDKI